MSAYAGSLCRHRRGDGLEIAETSYRREQRVAAHEHERPMVVFLLAGSMREFVKGRSVDCAPGQVLFHPAGEAHAHYFHEPDSRCMALQMSDGWLDRLGVERGMVPDGPVTARGEVVTGSAWLLHAEFRRGSGAVSATLDGLALTLLSSLARSDSTFETVRRPGFLEVVLERLHDDPTSDVRLSSLAELAGVTPEHLARTFRDHTGATVGSYLRRLRVDRARRELLTEERSIGCLALELGFYDQSHFTRVFKAHVGCPPGEYRRRNATGDR